MNLPMIGREKGSLDEQAMEKEDDTAGKNGSTRVRTGDPHYVKVMW